MPWLALVMALACAGRESGSPSPSAPSIADGGLCEGFVGVEVTSEFEACGGEPFGVWRSVSVEDLAGPLHFERVGGSEREVTGSCPTRNRAVGDAPSMLLSLESGGRADVRTTDLSVSFELDRKCVDDAFPGGCEALGSCRTRGPCLCECQGTSDLSFDDGTWSRTDGTLTYSERSSVSGAAQGASYEYCVEGDTMQLFTGWLVVTLERIKLTGPPAACSERPLDACGGGGCRRGACTGPVGCNGQSEGACGSTAGCSWDPDVCVGTANGACELDDYGVVAGCDIVDASAICANVTETPCGEQLLSLCDREPGCARRSRCVGGPIDCGAWSGDCVACERTEGCRCAAGICSGTAGCESQTEEGPCTAQSGCDWVTTCEPASEPCAGVPLSRCNAEPGCRVLSAEDPPCQHMDCGVDRGTDCGSCTLPAYCSTAHRCEPACAHSECGTDHDVACGTCAGATYCTYGHCAPL